MGSIGETASTETTRLSLASTGQHCRQAPSIPVSGRGRISGLARPRGSATPLGLLDGFRHLAGRPVLLLVLLPFPHRFLVLAVDHVAVDVKRSADAGVPQARGNGWHGGTGCQHVRGVRMAEEVKRTALGLGNAEAFEEFPDRAGQGVGLHRIPVRPAKDQVQVGPVGRAKLAPQLVLLLAVRFKGLPRFRWDHEDARVVRLGPFELEAFPGLYQRAFDVGVAILYIRPPERQYFPAANAECGAYLE